MTPSDKAEAERRYPEPAFVDSNKIGASGAMSARMRERAAFEAGIKFAEERAALAASGPAAGVGEAARSLVAEIEYWHEAQTLPQGLLNEARRLKDALASSPPPAPAGVDRERAIEALKDIARQNLTSEMPDVPEEGSIEDGYDECIRVARRALASEAGPAEGEATELCEDCPPVGYPTDKTRCGPCPRQAPRGMSDAGPAEGER